MLSSGTAAKKRSTSVCSAGALRAVTTAIGGSVDGSAECDVGVEVRVAPDEAARQLGQSAGVHHEAESLPGSLGNRDEHGVRAGPRENQLDLAGVAQVRDALQPAPGQPRIVVDEADDLLAGCLTQFAEETSPTSACPHDAGPVALGTAGERRDAAHEGTLPEAGGADQHGTDERVDDEHAPREGSPGLRRVEDEVRDDLRDDNCGDDARCIACAGVAPDSAVEPER